MSTESGKDDEVKLLVEDNKGAFDTFDRFNSDTIVRRARRWNIHIPANWFQNDGRLGYRERMVVTRLINRAVSSQPGRPIYLVIALALIALVVFRFDLILDALLYLFG